MGQFTLDLATLICLPRSRSKNEWHHRQTMCCTFHIHLHTILVNHVAMGRVGFLVYMGFVNFFCSFVGEQTQSSSQPNFESRNLWCLFANSCWNTMLHILFSLLCVKYIFSWFYQSIGFKGNNKYAKKGITSAMECADIASFTFAMWQIRLCLLCKFIHQEWQSF